VVFRQRVDAASHLWWSTIPHLIWLADGALCGTIMHLTLGEYTNLSHSRAKATMFWVRERMERNT
jgi:hypothetical protein